MRVYGLAIVVMSCALSTALTVKAQISVPLDAPTLRGVVTDVNNAPLAGVRVRVTEVFRSERAVVTDDRGRFTVRLPESPSVRVTFTKAPYGAVALDIPGRELRTGKPVERRVRRSPGAAVSGRIRDPAGAPVMRARVVVRQKNAKSAAAAPVLETTSNDLGEYRIGGLAPGTFTLSATPSTTLANGSIIDPISAPSVERTVDVRPGSETRVSDIVLIPYSINLWRDGSSLDPNAAGSIRGRVVTRQAGAMAGAVVEAHRDGNGASRSSQVRVQVKTDGQGQFLITGLEPGEYRMRAFKDGFITPGGGLPQHPDDLMAAKMLLAGRIATVRTGETTDSGTITLVRGAAIAGTVVDEFGQPMQGVAVNVLELWRLAGETRALRGVSTGRAPATRTDDRGQYRVFGLHAGTYVIEASSDDVLPDGRRYVPQWGAATLDSARRITLALEGVATGADLALRPASVHRIVGTVVDPAGQRVPARITLWRNERAGAIQTEAVAAASGTDGTFTFDDITDGDYVVHAITTGRSETIGGALPSGQLASAFVSVAGGEAPPVTVRLSAGATLMGRIVYEGVLPPPPGANVHLKAIPVALALETNWPSDSGGFSVRPDNTFEYRGVVGRNFLTVRPHDSNVYVKSITYQGRDLSDEAFDFGTAGTFRDIEIVLSAAGGTITGRVIDDRAIEVDDYVVTVFSVDPAEWTMRGRRVKKGFSAGGLSFRVTGLAPGDYWVAAIRRPIANDLAGDLHNPYLLQLLVSRAVRVTLGDGQSQALTLRLVRN